MRLKVTDIGLLIPKIYLEGISEVEIRKENGFIIVVPTTDIDPIFEMGKKPVACGSSDASEEHDKYLYDV